MGFLGPHNPLGLAVMALVLILAAVLWRGAHANRANRLAATVLALEALGVGSGAFYAFSTNGPPWIYLLSGALFVASASVYPRLISTLDTPLARPFRGRAGLLACMAFAAVVLPANVFNGWAEWNVEHGGVPSWANSLLPVAATVATVGLLLGVSLLGIYSLAAAVSAYWRTEPGSALRRRAHWWVVAFGTRDALWILHVLVLLALIAAQGESSQGLEELWIWGPPLYLLVYASALTYGILRSQLFDIELRLKWGISRGTSVTILVVAALVASKIAEFYLTRTIGYAAGATMAGLLLFFVPRLNKLGDKVAQKAMPTVQNTSSYVAFRKLEVYQAAVQSAIESGGISAKERDLLSRLQVKLGISREDALQVEADAAPSPPAPSPPPTAPPA
ncbi:MAG TPA: hypothetical protein VM327_02260 [Candidatus Thermoplasmatota archaeon]|nr:hypothetical protein [Candidatus Thermoplasmatota archaeon]